MSLTQEMIEKIIVETLSGYGSSTRGKAQITEKRGVVEKNGFYNTVDEAVEAAKKAQKEFVNFSLEKREKVIQAMRKAALEHAETLAVLANEETGFGRVEHKILKNKLAAEKTPGTECLHSTAYTGDYGMTLVEQAPYGVIGAITPSTNPTATVISNSIGMVAAGNGVVFNPHPGAKQATSEAIKILNQAIKSEGGPGNLLCTVKEPTIETSNQMMQHKDIRLLVVTGGEGVVKIAMKSGKKAIGAGPGNPPVIIDDTADIKKAARDTVNGASFDNNILCIAEKEVFVFRSVAEELKREMLKNNCYELKGAEIEQVKNTVFTKNKEEKLVVNKNFVGKNASYILEKSGIQVKGDIKLAIAEVEAEHPFVTTEMLMPVLAIVKVDTLEEAIEEAIKAENGCKHTAIMHSENVSNLTKAAKALDTTIFVKNAPSYAGLGFEGEGYATLTIATPTGEGLTCAQSFTRHRRCTLSGAFRII